MSAFPTKRSEALLSNIRSMFGHAIQHHHTPHLTNDDIYNALVRPEHAPKLRETDELVGRVQAHDQYNTRIMLPGDDTKHSLTINFTTTMVRLLPAYCQQGFHELTDPAVSAKVAAWVDRRHYIGRGFSKMRELVRILNQELDTPGQVKFYFNGITTLLAMDEDATKLTAALREAPTPNKLPSISRELRDAGVQATKFLSQMLLLPKEVPNATGGIAFYVSDLGYENLFDGGTSQVW